MLPYWRRWGARRPSNDPNSKARSGDPPEGPPAVHASGLSFNPSGSVGVPVLRDLSFHAQAGSLLLVAGATGAGKSTLLRLIAGLAGTYPDPHATGVLDVRAPGDPVTRGPGPRLPQPRPGAVALVPQSPRDALVSLDVFGALALPLEEQGRPRGETIRRVENALDHLGLLGIAGRDVARLSTGEARRVAIASALAQDARLLLLDEPLADLDPLGVKTLREDLGSLPGERTVVVAEHRHAALRDLVNETVHLLGAQYHGNLVREWPMDPASGSKQPDGPAAGIRARSLRLSLGGQDLVRGADLDLGAGVWGVLGPNGAGKTTLLETLAGLLPPAEGLVETAGVPVWVGPKRTGPRRLNEALLRTRTQVAFQEPREAFFAATVLQELRAPLVARGCSVQEAGTRVMDAIGAMGRRDLVERSPARLSGGEARLVQLLGVLLGGPRVLFLDEPTHGLDGGLRRDLVRLIEHLGDRGHLVLVATHEPGILPPGTRWMFLPGDGRLLQGAQAAPGAPEPARAGFDQELLVATRASWVPMAKGFEQGVHA